MSEERVTALVDDFRRALGRLEEALASESTQLHKDATIQRFEFSFELAWKLMQAFAVDQGFDEKSPKSSIRRAANIGLIDNPEVWLEYLKKRNLAAHTYDEAMADEVYQAAGNFVADAKDLLQKSAKMLSS